MLPEQGQSPVHSTGSSMPARGCSCEGKTCLLDAYEGQALEENVRSYKQASGNDALQSTDAILSQKVFAPLCLQLQIALGPAS